MARKMLVFDFKPSERKFFEDNIFEDFNISFFEEKLTEKILKKIPSDELENTEIISLFIYSKIHSEILDAFKNLNIIATRSTGFNHINIEECLRRNVAVVNVSDYGTRTVVQYTIGVMIALVRKLLPAIWDMRNFENHSDDYIGNNLNALTLGVVGTGAIGTNICRFASFEEMKILAYDIHPKAELKEKYNVEYVDLEKLIVESDVITLHLPYSEDNYHMFSAKEFDKMKKTAYFINTSRGEIVDTYALYNSVKDKKIQGCALDVGECEDLSFGMEDFMDKIPGATQNCLGRAFVLQKMMELPNVIITPHISYGTEEAIQCILETTMKNITEFYKGNRQNRIV